MRYGTHTKVSDEYVFKNNVDLAFVVSGTVLRRDKNHTKISGEYITIKRWLRELFSDARRRRPKSYKDKPLIYR